VRSFHLRVDVSEATGLADAITAVTVHVPDSVSDPVTVLFGYPGGGYGRGYFDIRTVPGYSEAEHHCSRGFVVVACDHLGVGGSSRPDTFALTYELLAAANHATAVAVLERLANGSLADGLEPLSVTRVVATGQSMGGCLLTVQQANHRTFDGVGFLGWSGIFTNFPAPDGSRVTFPMPPRGTDLRPIASEVLGVVAPDEGPLRYCFHWDDEEPALVEPDLASYKPYSGVARGDATTPWGSDGVPASAITMMTPGAVAAEAAAIDVPVLVGCGERDVVPDPASEASAYPNATDVRILVVPAMAHMHNFSRNRAVLWEGIGEWARSIPATSSASPADEHDT
jgi:pimeloyl-ACP methyl ester carboxylesterase